MPDGAVLSPRRAIAVSILPTTVSVLPSFLAGTLAVQMQRDLGFDAGDLGLLFGAFFGAGALGSAVLGRVAERIGPATALRLAALGAGADLVAIGLLARSFEVLLALLAVGGLMNSLAQPAANLWLSRTVAPGRHGMAFGAKQSAIPAAMLLGGLAVPVIALPLGWRWAFIGSALLAVAATAVVPSSSVRPGSVDSAAASPLALHLVPLLVLAVGISCGAAAAGTLGSFMVSASVDAGISEGGAGLLFAAGSATGLAARLWFGARADRIGGGQLGTVAVMMAGGSVGYLALATSSAAAIVAVTPLLFAIGWGWPGLFNLSIVRHHPGAAGAATGITQTGTYIGAVGGPVTFGAAVDAWGFGATWLMAAGLSLAAAATTVVGRALLRRSIGARQEALVGAALAAGGR